MTRSPLFDHLAPAETWRIDAACRGLDPDIFFPDGSVVDRDTKASHKNAEDLATAKRICADCLCRQQCLHYALTHKIKDGVWGGLSEKEREHLHNSRRQRRVAS